MSRKKILSHARSYQFLTKMPTLRDTFQKMCGPVWSGVPLLAITPALRDMSLSARSSGVPHLLSALCSPSLRGYPRPLLIYLVKVYNLNLQNFCVYVFVLLQFTKFTTEKDWNFSISTSNLDFFLIILKHFNLLAN